MRVISGKFKGSILFMVKDKSTRPLKDLARESIFNLLTHSKIINFKIDGSNILDLYSGTGSFGLECLSREANSIYFVENNKPTFDILKKNIDKLNVKTKSKIFFYDVFHFIKKENISKNKFDLIFCDPPFKNKDINILIDLILNKNLLTKNGILILHRNKNTNEILTNKLKIIEERIYGNSKIIFGNLLSQ
jgi:16S rRNA (guanine966-N2)-methyltransferase